MPEKSEKISGEAGFNYKDLLNYHRRKHMRFSEFVEQFLEKPESFLQTSSTLIFEAVKHFGYKIVIRSGEPVISYTIFEDIFSNGVNAVYGQEHCIKKLVDMIESLSKESGPNRGIVLVGPPASGKTNIVDLICLALEQYTKDKNVKLYSFFYHFTDVENPERGVEIRSSFMHNPILFFTTILQQERGITRPRQELFEHLNRRRRSHERLAIPTYYQNASLDKRNLDMLESLIQHPRNQGKSLFDIIEAYVRVEEIEFNCAQGIGIANIDDLKKLPVRVSGESRDEALKIINQHLPTRQLFQYEGPLVACNRGVLHIHDAFTASTTEEDYKPLLLLLGSGKIAMETTQAAIDTAVVVTTNIEDMKHLDKQLSSSKLLDRIEKIPVNYLLDANSEMDILRRDMSIIRDKYDVDPNLFRIAAYYSVMTRLLPPMKSDFPAGWSEAKKGLFRTISPEQKLYIYSRHAEDPLSTIRKLPYWHPFRNQAHKLGIDLSDEKAMAQFLARPPAHVNIEGSYLFTSEHLKLVDDEFMRELWNEYYLSEGRHGLSIRQLQNIMRNTISRSDGRKILVSSFLAELRRMIQEGSNLHSWLSIDVSYTKDRKSIRARRIGPEEIKEGEGDYGDYRGLIRVVEVIYHSIIRHEIVTATVDRDPAQAETDLRKFLQMVLLAQAIENKAFAHIMVPKFTFVDPSTGEKADKPDLHFLESIERIIAPHRDNVAYRREMAQKFFDLQDGGKLTLEKGKTVIHSRNDALLGCFDREYALLLSHRREEETIDGELLAQVFFLKLTDPEGYLKAQAQARKLAENILRNMAARYGYSHSIALETIIYALRRHIVNFREILN